MLRRPGSSSSAVHTRRPDPRRRVAPVAVVVAMLTAVLGPLAPAAAHDVLLETSPADGAVLDAPPSEVALTFSADQIDMGAAITVTDADGTEWAEGETVVDGPVVRQALPADLPAGWYQVAWRSVSSDGHALTGDTTFEVTAAAPVDDPVDETVDPADEAAGGEDVVEEQEDEATAVEPSEPAEADESAVADDDVAASDDDGGFPVWLVVVLAVLVIGGAAFALLRRNRASES